jgi:hypothetical protein
VLKQLKPLIFTPYKDYHCNKIYLSAAVILLLYK